ncbi:hypothetical protein AVEN_141882-1 [Araneus ventricosus]|uniref:Uncharacterized protein n=1 Tax=Araneus ventricosus TaxID=182803 RepID=A0A4Y2LT77_ARAVE|nr:hypothetical protein AVEN_141882-1 [Araneus ventricosus]
MAFVTKWVQGSRASLLRDKSLYQDFVILLRKSERVIITPLPLYIRSCSPLVGETLPPPVERTLTCPFTLAKQLKTNGGLETLIFCSPPSLATPLAVLTRR